MSPFSLPSKPFFISTGLLSFDGNCGDFGGEFVGEFCDYNNHIWIVCVHMCVIRNSQHHQQTPSFVSTFQARLSPQVLLMVAIEYATMTKVCGTSDPFLIQPVNEIQY